MRDFLNKIEQTILNGDRVNFRDRRAHYASDALKCLRDAYWSRTGVPKTNNSDLESMLKMMYGSAVGEYVANHVLSRMFKEGYFLEKAECPVGGSDPDINGYLDALMYKIVNGKPEYFVVEVKTVNGYGANLLCERFEAKDSYIAQLGIYLKDMHNKGITAKGCLFYFTLSDKSLGCLVMLHAYYDPNTDEIIIYKGERRGNSKMPNQLKSLDQRLRVGQVEERLRKLDEYITKGQVPPADFVYKYDITPESVATWSDNDLLKALKDGTVKGDWQVKYSAYKDLQLETDGVAPGYTDEEIKIIKAEKRKRTPNSPYVK